MPALPERLEERHLDEELRRVEVGGVDRAGALGDADVQELADVVPVVEGAAGVDALVALQADAVAAEDAGDDVADLGLADAGHALEQQRLAELEGEVERGDEALVGEIAGLGQGGVQRILVEGRGHQKLQLLLADHAERFEQCAAASPPAALPASEAKASAIAASLSK